MNLSWRRLVVCVTLVVLGYCFVQWCGEVQGDPKKGTTKVYSVRRFCRTATQGEQLVDMVTRVIQPQKWAEYGGPARAEYRHSSRRLVVTIDAEGHADISRLLTALDKVGEFTVWQRLWDSLWW